MVASLFEIIIQMLEFRDFLNPINDEVSDHPLLPGGSLGPQSYFLPIIRTSFWTHGTIVNQYLAKGVHRGSCSKKKFRESLNIGRVIAMFYQQEKFLNISKKIQCFYQT